MIRNQEPGWIARRFRLVMGPLLRYPVRLAALYLLLELVAVALLIRTLGWGWALLVLIGTFLVGAVLASMQLKGQVAALRQTRRNPQGAVADGMLVGLGAFLVFIPGVVSTAAGALMLAPPTREAMRPLAETLLTRGIDRRLGSVNLSGFRGPGTGRSDYIDGEIIDGEVTGDESDGGDNLPIVR
jgi:UPF0716 protein FxsA